MRCAVRGRETDFAVTSIIIPVKADGPNKSVQGINMVDAAKEAGVKFSIFASLPSLAESSGGKYKNALHYELEGYLRASGLPHACLNLGSFLENYWASVTLPFIVHPFLYSLHLYIQQTRRPAKDTR
ncbi:hypothetical protein C8R47DRAFT_1225760 [Mycena vitilis]|nr:hypothetical protein C8R47DRAFT_1225760 [Mycena vitilis]